MKRILSFGCIVLSTLLLSGCAASKSQEESWSFSIAAPKHYEVWVQHLEFEKSDERHWRMPIGGVSCCWKGSEGPRGPGGLMTPWPDYIGVQWYSYAEQKIYQRIFSVPKEIRKKMKQPVEYRTSNGAFEAPRDMLVIGLAPGGTIVLWIMNQIGNEVEVARLKANEINRDKSGFEIGTERYLEENSAYLEKHGIPTEGW
ncbi:DUF2931 family protein [Marinobacter sp. V034]|uniref:DUF2931 family protein n=1 Tax=Marinobacter sp. V034 TaxID=3459610 RepID=UPI0040439FB9